MLEFVPKVDSQVEHLLKSREDIFPEYNQGQFESSFKNYFRVVDMVKVRSSERYIYLMENLKI